VIDSIIIQVISDTSPSIWTAAVMLATSAAILIVTGWGRDDDR